MRKCERFTVGCIGGRWVELYTRDSKRGYVQRQDMSASVNVTVFRSFSRDRNGKKVETVVQCIAGDYSAVCRYVDTFPPVAPTSQAMRVVSELANVNGQLVPIGMRVQTSY